jgi:stage II sporulation protein AA (anti-sigma F factor antagonist)
MASSFEHAGDVSVLRPSGRLDSITAASIEKEIAAVSTQSARVVLDLSELDYLSSAGVRMIVISAKRLKQRSGTFVLCNPQPMVRQVLELSGLFGVLTVASSLAQAMSTAGGTA